MCNGSDQAPDHDSSPSVVNILGSQSLLGWNQGLIMNYPHQQQCSVHSNVRIVITLFTMKTMTMTELLWSETLHNGAMEMSAASSNIARIAALLVSSVTCHTCHVPAPAWPGTRAMLTGLWFNHRSVAGDPVQCSAALVTRVTMLRHPPVCFWRQQRMWQWTA